MESQAAILEPEELENFKININITDRMGRTIAHIAAINGAHEILTETDIFQGLDIRIPDNYGMLPI